MREGRETLEGNMKTAIVRVSRMRVRGGEGRPEDTCTCGLTAHLINRSSLDTGHSLIRTTPLQLNINILTWGVCVFDSTENEQS